MAKKTTLPNTPGRQRAQAKYNSKPSSIADRSARNSARRLMVKAGKVHKGDGRDVDHKNSNPRDNSRSNLRVQSPSKNRSRNARNKK